ncbi:MAG: phosphopantothenoylcysteine decarboxylase [Bacillota bacterium]
MIGKTILITSGGCLEKWDKVRGHTNLATGSMGKLIAEEFLNQGADVIYLHGYFSAKPVAKEGQNLQLESFEGILDLEAQMKKIICLEKIDSVIMAAAGSDWIIDYLTDQNGEIISQDGKISSDNPPIIHLKKAPKILKQIKSWDASLLLVGFKLESDLDKVALVKRAEIRMRDSDADYMVANSSDSLYTQEAVHYIFDKEMKMNEYANKSAAAKGIAEVVGMGLLQAN